LWFEFVVLYQFSHPEMEIGDVLSMGTGSAVLDFAPMTLTVKLAKDKLRRRAR
jgi:hypothetical protein